MVVNGNEGEQIPWIGDLMNPGTRPRASVGKVSYTHAAMVDLIVTNPMISQGELARHFGYTEAWISRILNSDAVKEMIAMRKEALVDPLVLQSLDTRFKALAARSAEVLLDKLELPNVSADVAIKTLDVSSKALGYGAQKAGVNIQQNFVVAMPTKAVDGDTWAAEHSPRVING